MYIREIGTGTGTGTETETMDLEKKKKELEDIRSNICCFSYSSIIFFTLTMLFIGLIIWGHYKEVDSADDFKYETFDGWIVSHDSYYNPTDGYYHLNMNGEKSNGLNCTYYDYYVGTESIMNIIIEENTNTQIKWYFDPVYGNCVDYYKQSISTGKVAGTSAGFGTFALFFCLARITWIIQVIEVIPDVINRLMTIQTLLTFISFITIVISGSLLLDQNIHLLRNKVNWHFKNFEGNIGSYDINFSDGDNQYHLNMIGSNTLGFCTYYNYYAGTLEEIKTVIDNELYSSVK